jgi:hypothetical protein
MGVAIISRANLHLDLKGCATATSREFCESGYFEPPGILSHLCVKVGGLVFVLFRVGGFGQNSVNRLH